MTRCYFDMFDVCQAYEVGHLLINTGRSYGWHELVDSGIYQFPFGYNPLDKTAVELYIYANKESECYGK